MDVTGGPLTYSGYLLTAPCQLRWERAIQPELPADRVRVRFLYCAICGSDLSSFEGRRDLEYPISLGHEFIAEVVAVGDRGDEAMVGEFVTSDLNYRCGECDHCSAGRSHLCRRSRAGLFSNRGFAEYADIDAGYLTKLGRVARRQLALTEPLSCVLHAKQWVDPAPGERVLVIGAGGLGSCTAFALCAEAIEFEIVEGIAERLASIGAAIAPVGHPVSKANGEYDAVFDLSGSEAGLRLACEKVRSGGRLCSMSHLDGYSRADFLLSSLVRRDISFKVSYLNGERETMKSAAEMLALGWHDAWEDLIEIVPRDRLQEAFENRRISPKSQTIVDLTVLAR